MTEVLANEQSVSSPVTVSILDKPIVLLVAGSRHCNDNERVTREIDAWIAKYGPPDKLISGEAEGVDLLAKLYAQRNRIPYDGYPANWTGRGRQRLACGPKRNTIMVAACTHLLALPSKAHSPGTRDTIRKARAAHKHVVEKELN